MNRNYGQWMYKNLEDCCQRYYSWMKDGCILNNAQATLVSGDVEDIIKPTDGLYFPDWEKT